MRGRTGIAAKGEESRVVRSQTRNPALWHNIAKPEAVRSVNFPEDRLKDHREKLVEIAPFVGDPLD